MEWGRWRSMVVRQAGRVDWQYVRVNLAIAVVYIIAAKLGLSLAFATRQVTAIWPPTGIALVALLVLGRRYWPGVFVGALVANALSSEPPVVALSIAVGNTFEAVTGAWLVSRVAGAKPARLLKTARGIASLVVLAGLLSTLVSATIGTLSLTLGGLAPWSHFGPVWLVWWIGDMMGDLVFAPLIMSWLYLDNIRQFVRRPLEAACMLALCFALSVFVFTFRSESHLWITAATYMIFPAVIWAALRFTQIGVTSATAVLATTAVWGTLAHLGPYTDKPSVEGNLLELHVFLFVICVTSLLVASVVSERLRITNEWRRQSLELEKAQAKILQDLDKQRVLERELKEANRRITNLLSDVLDENAPRRGTDR